MLRVTPAVLSALMLAAAPVGAQDLETYDAADAAAYAAWEALPLTFRTVAFVTGDAGGYGLYDARDSTVFRQGEPIVLYVEPMGYGWRQEADGRFSFGFDIDIVLRNAAGDVVASQESFMRQGLTSRARNREFYLTLTLNMTGAPAGDYALEYIVHDLASDKIGTIARTFSIAAP